MNIISTSIITFVSISTIVGAGTTIAMYENVPEPKSYLGDQSTSTPVVSPGANTTTIYAALPQPKIADYDNIPSANSNNSNISSTDSIYAALPQPKINDYSDVPNADPSKTKSTTVSVTTNGNAQESVTVVSDDGLTTAEIAVQQTSSEGGEGTIFLSVEITE